MVLEVLKQGKVTRNTEPEVSSSWNRIMLPEKGRESSKMIEEGAEVELKEVKVCVEQ